MDKNFTPLSQKVLAFIKEYMEREKFAPSQIEIKEHFKHKTLSAVQLSLKKDWSSYKRLNVSEVRGDQSDLLIKKEIA